ncbi:MAG: hypothetical protein E6J36_03980 [Chloroflexi bacterium]|nr:MAG: hypothetical protein E6J36_03980 [Chloroflexota bacterium]TMD83013.1 MAG: hypothetical protein E6I79_15630 [Chloroflexota bacterium]
MSSRRIAYRPRYRNFQPQTRPSPRTRQEFFRQHWSYRRLNFPYQKPTLGQGLLLIPIYRFVHSIRA